MTSQFSNLKDRYVKMFSLESCQIGDLEKIEKKLNIKLPKDFWDISQFYSGGIISGCSVFSINSNEQDEYGVIFSTKAYRKNINLPHKYLALSESSCGMVLLDTETGEVLDFPIHKVLRMCEEGESITKEDKYIYPSFFVFFDYLLTEEEKERI